MSDNFNSSKIAIVAGVSLLALTTLLYLWRRESKQSTSSTEKKNEPSNKNNNNNNNNSESEGSEDKIIITSRGSALALIQSEEVKSMLIKAQEKRAKNFAALPMSVEIHTIATKGDKILDQALSKIGDKGLFTKELEHELLNNRASIAVHSLKDMPTVLEKGLTIGAITKRESPEDCVVMSQKNTGKRIEDLPEGSIVGSSSLRRIAQLKRKYPSLKFIDIRGNLNTRLKKLDEGQYDCIILAVAGLTRLGPEFQKRISQKLDTYYAVGQGALAVECRKDDDYTLKLLSNTINDVDTQLVCSAERAFLRELEGGCQNPIGVKSSIVAKRIQLSGIVLSLDGSSVVEGSIEGAAEDCEQLGVQLAVNLKKKGADKLIRRVMEQVEKEKKEDQNKN